MLVAGACIGCALPHRKVDKTNQGLTTAQSQSAVTDSVATNPVVPIPNASLGSDNAYPIQQVAAYAPASSGAIVRQVPDAIADFDRNGLPTVPSSLDNSTPIVVSAPQPGFNDVAMTDAVGLGHGHVAARQLQPPSLAERVNSEVMYGSYLIETGDSLDIKFRNTTELDEVVTVRPDGMISLPIVGDVQAAGLTPEGLRQTLMARFSNELKKPDIAVIVRSFSGNNVYIGGEVFSPGRIPLQGRVTTLNAIILAGGFKDTADQKRVIVRRADGSCCEYDLKSVLECKGGRDIPLQPYDVVYVPKSHIAKVNQFVDQYIEKVLPFSRSFGIFVSHNTGLTSAVGSP